MARYYHSFLHLLKIYFPTFYPLAFQYRKLLKYLVSGVTAATVTISTLYVLTEYMYIWYLFSAAVGFILGVIVSFILQKFWTFRDRSVLVIKKQFTLFVIVSLTGLCINSTLIYVFVEYGHIWYLLSQILSGLVITCINLFLYQHLVFKKVHI